MYANVVNIFTDISISLPESDSSSEVTVDTGKKENKTQIQNIFGENFFFKFCFLF